MKNVRAFEKTFQETNELLKEIEKEFGWEGQREIAYDALRSILHTLRDRLTVEEAADFSSQLPMLVKGVFYDGFKPAKMPIKMDEIEFVEEVMRRFPLSMDYSTKDLIQGVLLALSRYVSEGEMKNVIDILPGRLASYINT
jgi:uncharacterized protein (DUF2267 family)